MAAADDDLTTYVTVVRGITDFPKKGERRPDGFLSVSRGTLFDVSTMDTNAEYYYATRRKGASKAVRTALGQEDVGWVFANCVEPQQVPDL